jgi:hypothetical protein
MLHARIRLQLLNSTVASLAKATNDVLTKAYHLLYSDDDEEDEVAEVVLLTSPLNAAAEVTALFSAGIIDRNVALPAAMHSLSSSASEIEAAMQRAESQTDVEGGTPASDAEVKNTQASGNKSAQSGPSSLRETTD